MCERARCERTDKIQTIERRAYCCILLKSIFPVFFFLYLTSNHHSWRQIEHSHLTQTSFNSFVVPLFAWRWSIETLIILPLFLLNGICFFSYSIRCEFWMWAASGRLSIRQMTGKLEIIDWAPFFPLRSSLFCCYDIVYILWCHRCCHLTPQTNWNWVSREQRRKKNAKRNEMNVRLARHDRTHWFWIKCHRRENGNRFVLCECDGFCFYTLFHFHNITGARIFVRFSRGFFLWSKCWRLPTSNYSMKFRT